MVRETTIIDGKEVTFAASASIPRIYRIKFKRDIFHDIKKIADSVEKAKQKQEENGGSDIPLEDLEMFENVAYAMAYHASANKNEFPSDIMEWLDNFNTFSIYQVFPVILKLWNINQSSIAESKKNLDQAAGK